LTRQVIVFSATTPLYFLLHPLLDSKFTHNNLFGYALLGTAVSFILDGGHNNLERHINQHVKRQKIHIFILVLSIVFYSVLKHEMNPSFGVWSLFFSKRR